MKHIYYFHTQNKNYKISHELDKNTIIYKFKKKLCINN